MTLVLRGSYSDELGSYGVGDVADLDEDVAHRPVACPEKGWFQPLLSESTDTLSSDRP